MIKKLLLYLPYLFIDDESSKDEKSLSKRFEDLKRSFIVRNRNLKYLYSKSISKQISEHPIVYFTQMQRGTCWVCAHLNMLYLIENHFNVENLIKEEYLEMWNDVKQTFDVNKFAVSYLGRENFDIINFFENKLLIKKIIKINAIQHYIEILQQTDDLINLIKLLENQSLNLVSYNYESEKIGHLICIYKSESYTFIYDSNMSEVFHIDSYLKYLKIEKPEKIQYRKLFSFNQNLQFDDYYSNYAQRIFGFDNYLKYINGKENI